MTDVILRRLASDAAPSLASVSQDAPKTVARVGGRTYQRRKVVPSCLVCKSGFREEIEGALLKSYTASAIVQYLPEDCGLSARNINEHVRNGHLPIDDAIVRSLVERRAEELGQSIEEAVAPLVDHISFARVGLQKAFAKLASDELEPTLADGIAFAKILQQVEESVGVGMDEEAVYQAFLVYNRAIHRHADAEQLQAISAEISADPVMAGLRSRALREESVEADASPMEG